MAITPAQQKGVIPVDGNGQPTYSHNVKNWRVGRVTVTAGAWVSLGDGLPRGNILLQSVATNTSNIILAPTNDGTHSNDPADDTCGLELTPGISSEPNFTSNLPIYARVEAGGADCRLTVLEAE
jgi:hypothetical protein